MRHSLGSCRGLNLGLLGLPGGEDVGVEEDEALGVDPGLCGESRHSLNGDGNIPAVMYVARENEHPWEVRPRNAILR